jgi:hypothetical protein
MKQEPTNIEVLYNNFAENFPLHLFLILIKGTFVNGYGSKKANNIP